MIKTEEAEKDDLNEREPEDLTEEETMLFQKLVHLSTNSGGSKSLGNSEEFLREARTKSSSTNDSENEYQDPRSPSESRMNSSEPTLGFKDFVTPAVVSDEVRNK